MKRSYSFHSSPQEGQATIEYILLLSIVVGLYILILRGLNEFGIMDRFMGPLKDQYASVYRYGHVKAKGYEDDGGPKYHPRIESGGENVFRIFINPGDP